MFISKKEYHRQWRAKNREHVREHSRRYYHANKERILSRRHELRPLKPLPPRTPEQIQTSRDRRKEYERQYHQRRLAFYRSLKEGKSCKKCGETNPACLDFHHRDGEEKEVNIGHRGRYLSRKRLLLEVAKCDILCVNCHRKEHAAARKGKISKYQYQVRKRLWVLEQKRASGCATCGMTDPECLDYHHIDPATKKFGIGMYAPSVSRARLIAEIKKCKILCANCHRKEHYTERQKKRDE